MNIACNVINQTIRRLAIELKVSPAFACNLVTAWQAENNKPNQYPTARKLKDRYFGKDRKDLTEVYYAVPYYQQGMYRKGRPLTQVSRVGDITLMISTPDRKQDYIADILSQNKHLADLKEVIGDSLNLAYKFLLWQEMAVIQNGFARTPGYMQRAGELALAKLKESINFGRTASDEAPHPADAMVQQQPAKPQQKPTAPSIYEVSSAGDRRFSAYYAKFAPGTTLFGHNVSGETIESVYQHGVKQNDWTTSNNTKTGIPKLDSIVGEGGWGSYFEGGGADIKADYPELPDALIAKMENAHLGDGTLTKEDKENISYYMAYLPMWKEWARQNPELIEELRTASAGKTLNDIYARNSVISQARALTDILEDTPSVYQGYFKTYPTIAESRGGYAQRTDENAEKADVTIALATDFRTGGEKRTARAAGAKMGEDGNILADDGKYISSSLPVAPASDVTGDTPPAGEKPMLHLNGPSSYNPESLAEEMLEKWDKRGLPKENISLNIAGNGIYTLAKNNVTQHEINQYVYRFIKKLLDSGITIREIRSGGQTGVDEAGIIAAQRLGISCTILAPKNFAMRGADNKDSFDKEKFLARFGIFPSMTPAQRRTRAALGNYFNWQKAHITKSPNFKKDHEYFYDGEPIDYSVSGLRELLWPKNIEGDHSYATAIGNGVDAIVRDYFRKNVDPRTQDYPNFPDARKEVILKECERIEQYIEKKWGKGCIIITEEFTLTGKINLNGREATVAGTMDMLVIDRRGKLHILDMKAKKRPDLDSSFDDRRDYTYNMNGYRQLLEIVPGLEGLVEDLHLIWFSQDYPQQGTTAQYYTQENEGQDIDTVLVTTAAASNQLLSDFSGWKTPTLNADDNIAFPDLTFSEPFENPTPLDEIQQTITVPTPPAPKAIIPKRDWGDNPPRVGRENFSLNEEDPRSKLVRDFSPTERTYRVEMMARDFSKHMTRAIKKEKKAVHDRLNQAMKDGDTAAVAELYVQAAALDDEKTARREIIDKGSGIRGILDTMKAEYREQANMSDEEAREEYGDRADHVKESYRKVLDNFLTLMQEVAPVLERNGEPVRFVFGKDAMGQDSGTISKTNDDRNSDNDNFSDNDEGKAANGNDGWNFKAKYVEPHATLTKAVKNLITNLKRIDSNGRVEYDDLGNIRYLSERYAYASLLAELSNMVDADDFIVKNEDGTYSYPYLEELRKVPQYYWVEQVINEFKKNPNLASQFFRNFRKDAVAYYTQKPVKRIVKDASGNDVEQEVWSTVSLNKLSALDATTSALKRNWANEVPQHPESLYSNTGDVSKAVAASIVDKVDALFEELSVVDDTTIGEFTNKVADILTQLGFSRDSLSVEKVALEIDVDGDIVMADDAQLRSLLRTIKLIASDIQQLDDEKLKNTSIIDYFSTAKYRNQGFGSIASMVGIVTENDTVQMFRAGDSDYPSYTAPDFSNKVVKSLKREDKREALIAKFKADSFFYQNGQWLNEMFRLLESDDIDGKAFRAALDVKDEFMINGTPYEKWTPYDIKTGFIFEYFSTPINSGSQHQFAWYNFPIFSDTTMARFIKLPRYTGKFKEAILPQLVNLVKQELTRIDRVQKRKPLIEKREIAEIPNYDKNGENFFFLPELRNMPKEVVEEWVRLINSKDQTSLDIAISDVVAGIMEESFRDFFDNINSNERDTIATLLVQEGVIADKEGLEEALEEYFWNHHIAEAQIIQLFSTDLAYYKDDGGIDFQKRWKEVYAGGEKLNVNSKWGKRMETSIILKDEEITSTSYQQMSKSLFKAQKEGRLSDMDVEAIRRKFKEVNATDGQGLRTLTSFRSLLDMMGEWTPSMQKAFDHFIPDKDGKVTWTMEDFNTVWQVVKPYLYTNNSVADGLGGTMMKPEQHKDSEALMLGMYTLIGASLKDSAKLNAISEWMDKNGIDVVLFESAVKVGGQGPININYSNDKLLEWILKNQDAWLKLRNKAVEEIKKSKKLSDEDASKELAKMSDMEVFKFGSDLLLDDDEIDQAEYERRFDYIEPTKEDVINILDSSIHDKNGQIRKDVVHENPYEDYCIQQPTPEHLFDVNNAVFGSQLRVLLTSDLPEDFSIKFYGKPLDKQKTIDLWQSVITENLLEAFEGVEKEFANIDKLSAHLKQQVRENSRYGRDLLDALDVVEVTDPNGNTKRVFNIPFFCPTIRAKIQELVLSTFKNQITKQTIHGGNAILCSNFGLTRKLHVLMDEKTGAVKGIECYLPAYSKEFYSAFMVEKKDENGNTYMELDISQVPEDLLRGIGYRIPTEGKYSMAPLIIKGFLPQQNGSMIMLPADITTLSGSDFDIDKLFLMLPNFDVIKHDKQKAREDYDLQYSKFLDAAGSEDTFPSFDDWYKENKEKYKLDKPIIRKARYNMDVGPQGNDKRRRDNLLIDLAFAVLTDKTSAPKVLNPGNFDNVKTAARINIISETEQAVLGLLGTPDVVSEQSLKTLADKLLKTGRKDGFKPLDKIAKQYAPTRNVLSLDTFIFNHQQNMAGASLIGMYANANTSQAKHQVTPMSIKAGPIRINGKLIKSLTHYESFDGEVHSLISKRLAELLAASVDNGKDPNLAALLQNPNTANILATMIRAGISIEEASLLITNPIVARILMANNTNYRDYSQALEAAKDNYKRTYEADVPKEAALMNVDLTSVDLLVAKLKDALKIDENDPERLDAIDRGETVRENSYSQQEADLYNLKVATIVGKLVEVADYFGELTRCTRADSPNGALEVTLEDANLQRRRLKVLYEKSMMEGCPIAGLSAMIKNSFLSLSMSKDKKRETLLKSKQPMLQAFYSLGIDLAQDLASPYFVEYGSLNQAVNALHDNSRSGMLKNSYLRTFYIDAFKYYMASAEMFGDDIEGYIDKRDWYLNQFPRQFLKVLKENPDIAKIGIIRKLVLKEGQIVLDRSSKLDSSTVEILTRDFDLMMYEMDNPAAQQLAMDLFVYCMFKDGLEFGPNNFGRFFSSNFLASIPSFIDRLRGVSDVDPSFWDNYLDQFYMYYGMGFCPKISGSNKDFVSPEGYIHLSKNKSSNRNIAAQTPYNYIIYVDMAGNMKFMRKVGETMDNNIYAPAEYLIAQGPKIYHPNMSPQEIAAYYHAEEERKAEEFKKLKEYHDQRMAQIAAEEVARAEQNAPLNVVVPTDLPEVLPTESGAVSDVPDNILMADSGEDLSATVPQELLQADGSAIDNMSDADIAIVMQLAAEEEARGDEDYSAAQAAAAAEELINDYPEDNSKLDDTPLCFES